MSNIPLGKLIEGEQNRDAIHVAIAPVIAAERLAPGWHIGLNEAGKASALAAPIGIVDPFLKESVSTGAQFWMMLYPGTITGLRHEWTHPALGGLVVSSHLEAKSWLHAFADKWNFKYSDMIDEAQRHGGFVVADGIDLHSASELDPGDEEKFWKCIEAVTGKSFGGEHRREFGWSCSC